MTGVLALDTNLVIFVVEESTVTATQVYIAVVTVLRIVNRH